jgi:pantoate--beta-alanine ligase
MELARTKDEVRRAVAAKRAAGKVVGLVPTMGFFHEGHLALMRICAGRAGFTVASLFVNPIQFGDGEDLQHYPRDEDRDRELAEDAGVDLLFVPSEAEMYAPGRSTYVEETVIGQGLCASSRPGHFKGVTTVVAKLFNIVQPDLAVFGRKDLQQLMVIRRMVRDLDFPVEIIEGPLVREVDGLAMSSRNVYLDDSQRAGAPKMYAVLMDAAGQIADGRVDLGGVLAMAGRKIERKTGGRVEYLEALDDGLEPATDLDNCAYLAAALHMGPTRLIDNVRVPPGSSGDGPAH